MVHAYNCMKSAATGFRKPNIRAIVIKKVCCTKLEPSDLVLVSQKSLLGKHKIQYRWENESYTVLEQVRPDALFLG